MKIREDSGLTEGRSPLGDFEMKELVQEGWGYHVLKQSVGSA